MKTFTFIFSSILLLCFFKISAQEKSKVMSNIRKEIEVINHDKTLKKVTLNNEEFLEQMTDGGGQLTGFYKLSQLRKFKIWVGVSQGNTISEYFYKENKLIFAYESFNSFIYDQKRQKLRLDKTERTFEGRYYFSNNKIILKTIKGKSRIENINIEPQKTLLEEAIKNKKLLENKKKAILLLEKRRRNFKKY